MPRHHHLLPFCLLMLMASPVLASAQAPAKPSSQVSHLPLKLRLTLPFTRITCVNPLGAGSHSGIGIVGLSLGVDFARTFTVEAGATWVLTSIEGARTDTFLRAGLAPVIADLRRPDGRGWMAQLDLLAGYRHLSWFDSPDAHDGSETTHGLTGSAGVEFVRVFTTSAFLIRLLASATLPVSQTHTGFWAAHSYFSTDKDLRYAADVGVELGLAL